MIFRENSKSLVVLPGPPRELKPMFLDHVLPLLTPDIETVVVRRKTLRVTGYGESKLDELIAPIYTKYENPVTSMLFSKTDIAVQFTATANTTKEADKLNEKLAEEVCEVLGDAVFSRNGEPMEAVVGKMLAERGLTISIAESCTGGLVAKRLTNTAGSSAYFLEGAVTYSNDAKTRALGVPKETVVSCGAVSAEVAEAMAVGMRERSGSDLAVSITGVAGPGGGSDEKPVGTVFIGFSDKVSCFSKKIHLPGDRNLIRWRSSQAALDCVRRQIKKHHDK